MFSPLKQQEPVVNNVLIQGDRHSGKTHLIGRIIDRYNDSRLSGFFTYRDDDGIVHFRAWDNASSPMQGPDHILFREDDGIVRYRVFEEDGTAAVANAIKNARLMIFDELGRFEQQCRPFTDAIDRALTCSTPVVAALKNESNPFLDALRTRGDCSLYTLYKDNRDELFSTVTQHLDMLIRDA